MENKIQTRAIPKKNMIIIIILILLGIGSYFITESGKSDKVTKILYSIGYTQISDVKVYGVKKVENKDTRIQGFKYFVIFKDDIKNKECRGFVMKDFKRKVEKDINCEDIK